MSVNVNEDLMFATEEQMEAVFAAKPSAEFILELQLVS